jgi:hypothetical protein
VETETHHHAGAAILPFTGRHRFVRHEQIVQPPWARKAGVEGGIKHGRRAS